MKKIIFTVLLFLCCSIVANANRIKSITMDIYLDSNGNAHIDEYWNMYTDSKTENYKPYYNLGETEITNFTVSDNKKTYTYLDNWNIDASKEEKAYKNGFYYEKGATELCWGISEYGNNVYHLSYDMSDMIINTSDGYQVFYWTLIPHDMDPSAESYDITIRTDNSLPDTLDVWGYGAYGKYAYVADGVIKFVGEDSLSSSEYVVGLVKFDPNTFSTNYSTNKSFDDIMAMAEEGAVKYKDSSNIMKVLSYIFRLIPYFFIVLFGIFAAKNAGNNKHFKKLLFKEEEKKLPKDYPAFRDIPCNKNIYAANYISWAYNINKNEKNFIGCIILKWLKDGIIKINEAEKKDPKIILESPTIPESYKCNSHEQQLYGWMYSASQNGVLTTKDFKKYCKNHYSTILGWGDNAYLHGKTECEAANYITNSNEKPGKYDVNHSFYEEGVKIAGLKKFLNEFSDMKNKEPIEVHLWQDYLIFAQMFGIAKKVAKKFNDLYPEVYEQANFNYSTFIFINDFTYSGYQAASAARSAAESYSSGGGGFSSGGGGGGSFGGGGGGGGSR